MDSPCPFCAQIAAADDKNNFILRRFEHTTVFLNIYPYNPGHLLIVPNRHVARLQDLTIAEHDELWRATRAGVDIVEKVLKNTGTNVGVNLGGAATGAGGSVPDHLHVHIIPRWPGDTGFLPAIAETKPLCEDLMVVYELLKKPFEKLSL